MIMVSGGFEFIGHDGVFNFLHGNLLNREVVLDIVGHVGFAVLDRVQRLLFVSASSHELRLEQWRGFGSCAILRGTDGVDFKRGIDDVGKTALLIEL